MPCGSPQGPLRPVLFEKGYCDKVLLRDGQLDNWKRYLDDNPRRLFIKRQHPEYFTILHEVSLMDLPCQIVGNRFLLDNPDKAAVTVHRAYSDQEFEDHLQKWLSLGEAGGVLISAAISPREKIVMREAMNRGYRLIHLRENGFPPLYKPSGEAFDVCSEGRDKKRGCAYFDTPSLLFFIRNTLLHELHLSFAFNSYFHLSLTLPLIKETANGKDND